MVFWLISLPWLLGFGMNIGAEPHTPAVRCSTDWQHSPLLIEPFIAHWHLFVRVFNHSLWTTAALAHIIFPVFLLKSGGGADDLHQMRFDLLFYRQFFLGLESCIELQ
jgi:hypothetical protein